MKNNFDEAMFASKIKELRVIGKKNKGIIDYKDIEKVLKNVVYLQLLRLGYEVRVGQLQAGEVDFVCIKHEQRIYVQVAYLIATEETREREFGTLRNIADNHPKYVISMSPLVKRDNIDGIIHLGLREFLLKGF